MDQRLEVWVPTRREALVDGSALPPRMVTVSRDGARGLCLLSLGSPCVSWGLGV